MRLNGEVNSKIRDMMSGAARGIFMSRVRGRVKNGIRSVMGKISSGIRLWSWVMLWAYLKVGLVVR